MFWGLLKLMWGLGTLPLRLVWALFKLAAWMVLPIMVMKIFKCTRK